MENYEKYEKTMKEFSKVQESLKNTVKEAKARIEKNKDYSPDPKTLLELDLLTVGTVTAIGDTINTIFASLVEIVKYNENESKIIYDLIKEFEQTSSVNESVKKQLDELSKHRKNLEWIQRFFEHQ